MSLDAREHARRQLAIGIGEQSARTRIVPEFVSDGIVDEVDLPVAG